MRLDILGIAHAGILVTQPDTMRQNAIAKRAVLFRQPVRNLGHLGKAHPGPDQADIGHHMLMGDLVEGLLFLGRGDIADNPAPRNITTIAVGADKIGVEGHHVAFLHDPWATFLEPGVGARARGQDAGLDPFAATLDVAGMECRPHLVLRQAGAHCVTHFLDRHLAGMDSAAHGADLVVILDRAGMFGQHLPLDHGDAMVDQSRISRRFDLVDGKPPVVAAMLAHQSDHLIDKMRRRLICLVTGLEIEKTGAVTDFADKRQMRRQMFTIMEIPEHHRAFRRHKTGPCRVMRGPELHVGGVGGVADIQRIEQQQTGAIMLADLLLQAREPVLAKCRHVRRLDPGCRPFGERQVGRSDFHPVIVIRSQVGLQMRAARRVDLAVRSDDGLVHGIASP